MPIGKYLQIVWIYNETLAGQDFGGIKVNAKILIQIAKCNLLKQSKVINAKILRYVLYI